MVFVLQISSGECLSVIKCNQEETTLLINQISNQCAHRMNSSITTLEKAVNSKTWNCHSETQVVAVLSALSEVGQNTLFPIVHYKQMPIKIIQQSSIPRQVIQYSTFNPAGASWMFLCNNWSSCVWKQGQYLCCACPIYCWLWSKLADFLSKTAANMAAHRGTWCMWYATWASTSQPQAMRQDFDVKIPKHIFPKETFYCSAYPSCKWWWQGLKD